MKKFNSLLVSIFLLFLCLFIFTSCVKETTTINIAPNNYNILKEEIATKELYELAIKTGSDPSEITENGGNISFFTENDIEYVKISETISFKSLSELNSFLEDLESYDSKDPGSDNFFHSIKIEFNEKEKTYKLSGKIGSSRDTSFYTSCDLIFNFPGKITKNNIGTLIDDNSIKIDMLNEWTTYPNTSFVVQAKSSSNLSILHVIVVVFALLVLALFVTVPLIKKYKRKNIQEEQNQLDHQ